jgi:hypothetical protein
MAPYALTPTTERGELSDGSWPTSLPTISPNIDTATQSIDSDNSSSDFVLHHSNGNTAFSCDGNGLTKGSSDGVDTPKSTTSTEEAYIHGYKEGYTSGFTKSHIALKHQPIAIIGMSCRFPGSVSTPDEFWELLARARTGFSPIPASRFSTNRFHHPNPGKSGTTNARGGNCTYIH